MPPEPAAATLRGHEGQLLDKSAEQGQFLGRALGEVTLSETLAQARGREHRHLLGLALASRVQAGRGARDGGCRSAGVLGAGVAGCALARIERACRRGGRRAGVFDEVDVSAEVLVEDAVVDRNLEMAGEQRDASQPVGLGSGSRRGDEHGFGEAGHALRRDGHARDPQSLPEGGHEGGQVRLRRSQVGSLRHRSPRRARPRSRRRGPRGT